MNLGSILAAAPAAEAKVEKKEEKKEEESEEEDDDMGFGQLIMFGFIIMVFLMCIVQSLKINNLTNKSRNAVIRFTLLHYTF